MRSSDWSSDVCSSDLLAELLPDLRVIQGDVVGLLGELHREQPEQRAIDRPTRFEHFGAAGSGFDEVFARNAAVVEHRLAQHALPQADRVDLVGLEGRMLPLDDDLDHLARALALAAVAAGDEDEIRSEEHTS